MSEEFIEDIIATTEASESGNGDTGGGVGDNDDNSSGASDAAKAVQKAEADKLASSSASDDSDSHTDADTDSSTGDDSVAPGDLPEVEELASQLGWVKDHKGADSVDAKTYILRSKDIQKTMKDHNKDLKNQVTAVQGSIEALKEHNDRVYKVEVKKLQSELTKLKAEKKAAVELADVEKVEEIDQRIDDVKKDIEAPVNKDVKSNNPVYDAWIEDNEWYLTNNDMAAYADTVAEQYAGAPPERIYALVRQKVAEVFPEKFETKKESTSNTENDVDNTQVVKADADKKVVGPKSPVEPGSRNGDTTSFTKADLSPDQLTIMNQFVKGGIMTEDQYVKDIAKLQGE